MNYLTKRLSLGTAAGIAAGFAVLAAPIAAAAQSDSDEARLRRLEAEVRALQREVFPGGSGRFFTPEIAGPEQAGQTVGTPSQSALTDVLNRLSTIEAQLAQLTARAEEGEHRLVLVEEQLESGRGSSATQPIGALPLLPAGGGNRPAQITPQQTQPEPAAPSPERLAAVRAIAKPQTGDEGDDEYVYGFRLWEAGYFPEARQQLRSFVDRYPSHWRLSYGRNLLGRAYLDDNAPREAASWFLQNYQADKQGVRAADSLLYLAESMIASGDTNRACIALSEFGEAYPALASGRLASDYESNRAKVDCD
jgi:TolA-binding protein